MLALPIWNANYCRGNLLAVKISKRTRCFLTCAVLTALLPLSSRAQQPTTTVKVPDSRTAVNIAEKALAKIYGKNKIEAERPLWGVLSNGVWLVAGTLHCKDTNGNDTTVCVGEVAMADIRQADGKVLRTGRTKLESALYTKSYCAHPPGIGFSRLHVTSTLAEQMTRKTVQPQPVTITGDAVLMVLVGRDGKVMCARGLLGDKDLVNAALAAVSQWEYSPYFLNGEPAVFETTVTIHFKPKMK